MRDTVNYHTLVRKCDDTKLVGQEQDLRYEITRILLYGGANNVRAKANQPHPRPGDESNRWFSALAACVLVVLLLLLLEVSDLCQQWYPSCHV